MKRDEWEEYLPLDIMENILWRLPVKSLIRFMCVCKAWGSLISDPEFAKSHLRQPTTLARSWVCKIKIPSARNVKAPVVRAWTKECAAAMRGESVEAAPAFHMGRSFKAREVMLLNSCDGLLCIVDRWRRGKMVIWNPSTRQRHRVRPIPGGGDGGGVMSDACCGGFAHDSSSDDYKVAVVYRMLYCNSGSEGFAIDVFSLKSNRWKTIVEEKTRSTYRVVYRTVVVHGALHWFDNYRPEDTTVEEDYWPACDFISVFDFAKEEFRRAMVTPRGCYALHLHPLGAGRLCLEHKFSKEKWVMKEYGDSASWTKLFINNNTTNPSSVPPDHIMLDYSENHQYYLLKHERQGDLLGLYDRNQNIYKNINKPYDPGHYHYLWPDNCARLYMETLVSPKPAPLPT